MNVFIVYGSHPTIPGITITAHKSRASAEAKAVNLINIMLKDSGHSPEAVCANWEQYLTRLQDEHGAQFTDVQIIESPLT